MQRTRGTHLLVEYLGCPAARLDDAEALETSLREAALAAGARVIQAAFHHFAPHGVTGFLLLEESHLSIHTWPERGYAAVDFFTCGSSSPDVAERCLRSALQATRVEILQVVRGALDAESVMHVASAGAAHSPTSGSSGTSNASGSNPKN
jgi:S-adenosylmethionine decarboxylase proenzyme